MRSGSESRRSFPRSAFAHDSRLGVADPSSATRVRQARAHERGVAPVVADLLALLVGGIVLLVDDHESQVSERGEHRRARAHHDVERPLPRPLPGRAAIPDRQRGVQHADPFPEAGTKRGDHLVRERDLGNEDERLLAEPFARLGALEVHLGLAAPGHAVQEEPGVRARAERVAHRCHRVLLRRREARALGRNRRDDRQRRGRLLACPAAAEAVEPAGQGAGEHASDRREVVVRDPLAEPHQFERERRRGADHARDRLDAGTVGGVHALDHEAAALARAERTAHFGAGHGALDQRIGNGIEKRLAERNGKSHPDERHVMNVPRTGFTPAGRRRVLRN
jgi:hypothetical protein